MVKEKLNSAFNILSGKKGVTSAVFGNGAIVAGVGAVGVAAVAFAAHPVIVAFLGAAAIVGAMDAVIYQKEEKKEIAPVAPTATIDAPKVG